MKKLIVIAKKDGFRRAGRAWSGTTEVPAADLTREQIARLKAEPLLVVQEVEVEDKPAGSGKAAGGKEPPPKG